MSEETRSKRGMGRTYLRGGVWWVQYSFRGKKYRESSESAKESDATKLLKRRIGEMGRGQLIGRAAEKITIAELLDSLITHLKTRGAKAVPSFESHLKPIKDAFSPMRAVDLTTARIEKFIQERREAKKAPATVNRETGALRQALNLARKQGLLMFVPYVPMLREDNARQGFFERADFEAIAAKLPDPINDIARFAYLTGWRKGEILPLTWDRIDREAKEIRLATSKNGEPRKLGYEGELADLIERRWKARSYQRKDGTSAVSEYVFHWPTRYRAKDGVAFANSGLPVTDYSKAWEKACYDAKLPGKLMHDFRRTAARDMVRAGTPDSVAMAITGHKTRSMFDRYNITSEDDKRAALRRTDAYRATLPAKREDENVVPMGSPAG